MKKHIRIYTLLILLITSCEFVQDSNLTSAENADKTKRANFTFAYFPTPTATPTAQPSSSQNNNVAISGNTNVSPTPKTCDSLKEGLPIGISCLHCAHPNARKQAMQIAEVLRDSCRENIALTFLVDGSFGLDRNFLGELIKTATANGATLHLYMYMGNGPWQRRLGKMPDKGFGSQISPEELRSEIFSNEDLRMKFQTIVKFNEPLIDFNNSKNGLSYIIPILEDNNDYKTAREFESLVKQTMLPQIGYSLGRSPCPNCYDGNDDSIPNDVFYDQHIGSAFDNIEHTNGLVVNDGKDFSFPNEVNNGNNLSFDQLLRYVQAAHAASNTFVIWNREYQGVNPDNSLNDPDLRIYHEVTQYERDGLLYILKNF